MAHWVTVALLAKPRGVQGELLAFSLSDSPGRFQKLHRVFLFREREGLGSFDNVPFAVEKAWWHGDRLVLKFGGVDSIPQAEALEGCEVRVPLAEREPLEAGAYYQSDLIGCELVDSSGRSLGRVTGWQEIGGPGLLEIDGDWLAPFTPAICRTVDVEGKRITVELPEGLRELNRGGREWNRTGP
jgi:16S rRNA processing protein RimM